MFDLPSCNMFSTSFKLRSYALVLLLSIVGLATATFEGKSSCGIQTHRASGLVLWCESHGGYIFNETIFVAPMNAVNNRVAVYSHESEFLGPYRIIATPYLETTSGQIMIVVSNITTGYAGSDPPTLRILSGSIKDLKSWTTVHTEILEAPVDVKAWVNGVFLFSTFYDPVVKNISYKALVPNNNGFSFVEIFSYSSIVQSNVRSWTMDGTSRLCLSLVVDESSIVCRSLTNPSVDLVIHSATNTSLFTSLVSDNNGRVFWAETKGNSSLKIWAASSAKTDVPAVIDRTTNTTFVSLTGDASSALQLGYDSYNKLVYWTENIPLDPIPPLLRRYSFGVFGWDGKTNAVVTYFVADKTFTSVGQICTSKGHMLLTSTLLALEITTTRRLYYTSASSAGSPASVLLFTYIFQNYRSGLSLACDSQTGWAVASFSDITGQVGSSVSAIRMDNTTSLQVQFSADVNMTLGTVTLTDGVIGYTLENTELLDVGVYDLFFYTLPIDDATGAPSSSDNNSPAGGVSFANQLVPFAYFVFGLFVLLIQ